MSAATKYNPDHAIHPGATLQDHLEANEFGVDDFARILKIDNSELASILAGRSPITDRIAQQLECSLEVPARLWLSLQSRYDAFSEASEMAEAFPIKEMVKRGILTKTKDLRAQYNELLEWLGCENLADWPVNVPGALYRQTGRPCSESTSECVWLLQGAKIAKTIEAPPYNEQTFRESLIKLRNSIAKIHATQDLNIAAHISKEMLSCGVIVVFVPSLPKTGLNGATYWQGGTPVIQMSIRGKYADIFWFTFFHEAAHILLHGRGSFFLDKDGNEASEQENEANEWAGELLIPQSEWDAFVLPDKKYYWNIEIKEFAKRIGSTRTIVYGRLCKEKLSEYKFYANRRAKLTWANDN